MCFYRIDKRLKKLQQIKAITDPSNLEQQLINFINQEKTILGNFNIPEVRSLALDSATKTLHHLQNPIQYLPNDPTVVQLF